MTFNGSYAFLRLIGGDGKVKDVSAGGGVEWMFARGWSAFLEGNYMDFGDHSHTTLLGGCGLVVGGCSFTTHAKAATVLVGVNWRWGGKTPGYGY